MKASKAMKKKQVILAKFNCNHQQRQHTHPPISAKLPQSPTPFAHCAIHRLYHHCVRPTATIDSCIFSQTRGTPRNAVGRTSFSVFTNEPCKTVLLSVTSHWPCPDSREMFGWQPVYGKNDTRRSYSRYPILREAGWLAAVVSLAHIGVVGTDDLAGGL